MGFEEGIDRNGLSLHGILLNRALASQFRRFRHFEETAVYGKYVRWCGRTGSRGPSYPIPFFLWGIFRRIS